MFTFFVFLHKKRRYLDPPINILVQTDKFNNENRISNQVYLCVYNFYEWKPLAIGNIDNTKRLEILIIQYVHLKKL